jgi:hypothetical protein
MDDQKQPLAEEPAEAYAPPAAEDVETEEAPSATSAGVSEPGD